MHVIIDDIEWTLTTFKNKPDVRIHKVLIEMAANHQKADGGAYMLNVLKNKPSDYIASIERFEMKYLTGRDFEADLSRVVGNNRYLEEFKSYKKPTWSNFLNNKSNVKQLMAYLTSGEEFHYTVNVMKLEDIDNPTRFVREQFQKVFQKEAESLFELVEKGEVSVVTIKQRFGIKLMM